MKIIYLISILVVLKTSSLIINSLASRAVISKGYNIYISNNNKSREKRLFYDKNNLETLNNCQNLIITKIKENIIRKAVYQSAT